MADYIPSTDSGYDMWLSNFSTLLTASPATYGLLSGDAVAVAAQYTAWHAAFLLASNPSTRTSVTVADKDTAKTNSLLIVRPYAQEISQNAGVDPADKDAIGVNPRTNGPSPIAPPTTAPVLVILGATPLQHTLRYHDEEQPETVRAKPFGVIALQLFMSVSETPIVDQDLLDFSKIVTVCPFPQDFLSGDVGKAAYYAARWQNRNGDTGPWSSIVNFTVANG